MTAISSFADLAQLRHNCHVAKTNAIRIGVLNVPRRTTADKAVFLRPLPCLPLMGGLAGVPLRTPVPLDAGTPTLPVPAHPIGVGSGFNSAKSVRNLIEAINEAVGGWCSHSPDMRCRYAK